MPTTEQDQRAADAEQQGRERAAAVGGYVLRSLGRPAALYRLEVRSLWGGHYRVNVFVGPDAASARIAHSYFLTTDGDGAVVASVPAVTRRY